jgi:hypothetical protein
MATWDNNHGRIIPYRVTPMMSSCDTGRDDEDADGILRLRLKSRVNSKGLPNRNGPNRDTTPIRSPSVDCKMWWYKKNQYRYPLAGVPNFYI